jgi:beta-glucosidase
MVRLHKSKIGGIPVFLRRQLIAICTVIHSAAYSSTQEPPACRNPKLAIEDRVAELPPRVALEEKTDQLNWGHADLRFLDTTGQFRPETAAAAFYNSCNIENRTSPHDYTVLRNALRRYQMEKPRLGIPWLIVVEALPGFLLSGATSSPAGAGHGKHGRRQLGQR